MSDATPGDALQVDARSLIELWRIKYYASTRQTPNEFCTVNYRNSPIPTIYIILNFSNFVNSTNEHILRGGNEMIVAILYRPISRFYKRKMCDVLFNICLINKRVITISNQHLQRILLLKIFVSRIITKYSRISNGKFRMIPKCKKKKKG